MVLSIDYSHEVLILINENKKKKLMCHAHIFHGNLLLGFFFTGNVNLKI